MDWLSGQPSDRRIVEPGEHGTYHSPTVPAVAFGGLVLTSGLVGMDTDRSLAPEGVQAQAAQALRVIELALGAVGAGLCDVVRLTVHLTSAADIPAASAALDEAFGRPWPPTTMVAVVALANPELLVEIDCVAATPAVQRG